MENRVQAMTAVLQLQLHLIAPSLVLAAVIWDTLPLLLFFLQAGTLLANYLAVVAAKRWKPDTALNTHRFLLILSLFFTALYAFWLLYEDTGSNVYKYRAHNIGFALCVLLLLLLLYIIVRHGEFHSLIMSLCHWKKVGAVKWTKTDERAMFVIEDDDDDVVVPVEIEVEAEPEMEASSSSV